MLSERESRRCQIKAKRQRRATQGTTIEPLRGTFRTCLNVKPAPRPLWALGQVLICCMEEILFAFFGCFVDKIHKLVQFRRDNDLRAAVALFAHFGSIGGNGVKLATSASGKAFGVNAIARLQILHHARCAQTT